MLGGTFFVICFLLNTLFVLVFAVSLQFHRQHLFCCIFNLQKYYSYFAFSFQTTVHLLYCLFSSLLNAKYLHCTLLVCWESPKTQFLPLRKHFNVQKLQQYLLCVSLASKSVVSTVLWHFKLKRHQRCLSCCCLHSKYTKHTLVLCS